MCPDPPRRRRSGQHLQNRTAQSDFVDQQGETANSFLENYTGISKLQRNLFWYSHNLLKLLSVTVN